MSDDLTCVGAIAGAFGVKGDVRIKSFCANPADIGSYSPFTSEDGTQEFKIKVSRPIKNGFAGRIEGMDNREAIEALKGTRLYVPLSRLPELPDDEYYHSDLIGLDVYDTGGQNLGQIRAVHDHGAGDLLEVFGQGWKSTVLLPFTKEAVPTVDLKAKRIITDPPEGLFHDGT
jgi:16S rRNA processing protein RimM